MMEVKVGQIWRDKDPRSDRLVVIQGVFRDKISLHTCDRDGKPLPGMPQRYALITRFYKGGRSQSFTLFKDVGP
jgi:hypothetical protein